MRGQQYQFIFSNVQVKKNGFSTEIEYSLNSNGPLHEKLFNQFISSVETFSQSQQIKNKFGDWVIYNNTIKQTLKGDYQIVKREQIQTEEQQQQVLSDLFEQVRDFQQNSFFICNYNFEFLGYSKEQNKYCFFILPYLITEGYLQDRQINISDDLNCLVRGQIFLNQTSRKLEYLALLKNFVCFFNEDYQKIKRKINNSYLQIMIENIFIVQKDNNDQFEFILAYPKNEYKNDIKKDNQMKEICDKSDVVKKEIKKSILEKKHLVKYQYDFETLEIYLEEQEKIQYYELQKQYQSKNELQMLSNKIDTAVEEYHTDLKNIEENYQNVLNLLEAQRAMYEKEYKQDHYDAFRLQQESLKQNLKKFKAEIQNLQNENVNLRN